MLLSYVSITSIQLYCSLLVYYAMSQEWGSLSNNAKNKHERRVIAVTCNLYAAYQATESCFGWGTNIQSYLPLLKKISVSSTNVKTYSAVVYKNYYSFNISVEFISLIRMYKNNVNVNFVFVASELQNVKCLYYPVLLNSLWYLIGVYV